MKVSDRERTDIPDDLGAAADEFIFAARKYREFPKRHHPDRLAGVVCVESKSGELVLYTDSPQYAAAIKACDLP